MTWRWRLGEVFGIVIYMHVTFLLLIAWAALASFLSGQGMAAALPFLDALVSGHSLEAMDAVIDAIAAPGGGSMEVAAAEPG